MTRESGPEPLHQTFIALEGQLKDKETKKPYYTFKAVSNEQVTEEYLASGRGPEQIEAARQYDIDHSYEEKMRRGAIVRAKLEAEKAVSILGRLGTAMEIGRGAAEKLQAQIDGFTDMIMEVYDRSTALLDAAQGQLFERRSPAPGTSREQQDQLAKAQRAHELATNLEEFLAADKAAGKTEKEVA